MADINPLNQQPVKTPDAMGLLSSITGIQQQRQQLQQTALQLQQTQAFQGFQKDFDPSQFIGSDGTLDDSAVRNSSAYKAAGPARELADQYIQKVKSGQLQNKSALQNLDNDALTHMSQGVGALANDKDVLEDNAAGRGKVSDFYRNFAAQSPNNARIAGLYGGVVQHAKPGDLADAVYSQQLMAADTLGQRTQQNPQLGSNAAGQATMTNPRTGLTALRPTTGAGDVNPTSSSVAANTSRGTGVAGSDLERSNDISSKVVPAQKTILLTQEVDALADQIRAGKVSAYFSKAAAAAGFQGDTAPRQLLEKDMEALKAAASEGAKSDARQAQVTGQFPAPTADNSTIHTAMDYQRGIARQDLARVDNLNKYRDKDPSLKGFQHSDDVLTRSTDPLMHEFKALKTPAERTAFYGRNFHDAKSAEAFRDKVTGTSHALGN